MFQGCLRNHAKKFINAVYWIKFISYRFNESIKCDNIFVIPNGVDLNIFSAKKNKEQNIKKRKER